MRGEYNLTAGIYKITNPKGKVYVGRSVNIKKRWNEHKNPSNSLIYRSIQKYGYQAHKFEVLVYASADHGLLNKLEVFFIKLFDSTNPENGLNLCEGGGRLGFSHTPETIEKMKINRKGWQNSMGRTVSEQTKSKISQSLKGSRLTIETLDKCEKERIENDRSDLIFDKQTGVFYHSKREAVKFIGISRNTLTKRLKDPSYRYTNSI